MTAPDSPDRGPLDPARLAEAGIRTVVIATPDLAGQLVGKRVPASSFARVAEEGVQVSTAVFALDIRQSTTLIEKNVFPLAGLHNGIPDVTLRPDLGTLRRAAWLDGVAICLGDLWDPRTEEYLALSPREILRRQIELLAERGLRAQVGTELEFYLFLGEPRTLRDARYRDLRPSLSGPAALLTAEANAYEPFFQKLRDDLDASDIEVEAAHPELGPGQWEMTFRYGDPLEIADRHALYKLAVRDAAAAAGMSATFMAKPLAGEEGSSCHIHVSLVDEAGEPVFWDDDAPDHISPVLRDAMAGVLEHLDELMAWYAPTVNASKRMRTVGRTWAIDNRTATVRMLGYRPGDRRFEFRAPGADANPYLALAGLLASIRAGLDARPALPPMIDGEHPGDTDSLTPWTLGLAVDAFTSSEVTRSEFGDDTVGHIGTLLRHEWEQFLATPSDWDLQRYFDRI
jgi:glutamine synthetase